MALLQVKQIEAALRQELFDLIDATDLSAHGDVDKTRTVLSRALSAFALQKLYGLEATVAAEAVTDGPGDNGVDAVGLLPDDPRVVVVQSKFAGDGQGGAALADMIKFRDGLNDLLEMNWSNFNEKVQGRSSEIETLLLNPSVRIDVIFAHTGRSDIAAEVENKMLDYVADVNDPTDIARFRYLGQSDLHGMLIAANAPQAIRLDVELSDWGQFEGPPQGIYGQVGAKEVAQWLQEFGDDLLAQNVRVVLPDSEINNSLVATLEAHPEHFWYLNNGLTVLCDTIARAPAGGTDRRVGTFSFEGASIVNGAQTAGSLLRVLATDGGAAKLKAARVMVRFIALADAPADFGTQVTRATNTQNRIGGRDFLSLDPEQARLRDEFQIDGLLYVFRSGETEPAPDAGCSVVDAAVALACATPTPALATQAKREVSRLRDETTKSPYNLLFNGSTTYLRVWRCVQVMRAVDEELLQLGKESEGRERGVAVHGNRLILHLVFRQIGQTGIDDPAQDWDTTVARATDLTEQTLTKVVAISESDYPGYPASLFKNATKCTALASKALAELLPPPTATAAQ